MKWGGHSLKILGVGDGGGRKMVGITWAADGVEEWKEKVQEGGLG